MKKHKHRLVVVVSIAAFLVTLLIVGVYFMFATQPEFHPQVAILNDSGKNDDPGIPSHASESEDIIWESYVQSMIQAIRDESLRKGETPRSADEIRSNLESSRSIIVASGALEKKCAECPECSKKADMRLKDRALTVKKKVRVSIDHDNFGSTLSGTPMLPEQEYLLIHHGIVPNGFEVEYVDGDGKPISVSDGSAPRLDRQAHFDSLTPGQLTDVASDIAKMLATEDTSDWQTVDWMVLADIAVAIYNYNAKGPSYEKVPEDSQATTSSPFNHGHSLEVVPVEKTNAHRDEGKKKSVEQPQLESGLSDDDISAFYKLYDLYLNTNNDIPDAVRQAMNDQYKEFLRLQKERRLHKDPEDSPIVPPEEPREESDDS